MAGHSCGGVLICSQTLRIEVPANFSITAKSSGGDVSAEGITGALTLGSSGGDVGVSGGAGALVLSSSGGDVHASGLTSTEVSAKSSGGDVDLGFTAPPNRVTATSSAGDVHITVPNTVSYAVTTHDSDGSTKVTVRVDSESTHTIDAESSAGNVRVAPSS